MAVDVLYSTLKGQQLSAAVSPLVGGGCGCCRVATVANGAQNLKQNFTKACQAFPATDHGDYISKR